LVIDYEIDEGARLGVINGKGDRHQFTKILGLLEPLLKS